MQHLRPPFRTQRSPCALALALLSLAVSCWSADLAWPAASDGAGLPAGWELERSTASMGKAEFSHGTLRLTCETVRACHLTRALGIDGTDQAPLRLECRIGVEHPEGLDGLPTYIALYWGPSSAICIGLGGIEQWRERWMPARRRAWSYWLNGPEHGFSRSESAFYSGAVRGHFRLLCTSHDVSAYASVDGLRWQLLSSFERKAGQFSGPPERVIIGRGWYGEQANQQLPHLLNDLGDPAQSQTLTWSVSDLSITTELPKAMLSQAYRKPKGFDEAHEAWLTPAPLRDWQVIGPMPWSDKPYPPEQAVDLKAHLPLADGHDGVWLPYPADEHNGAILSLKGVLKLTAENQLSYATAVVNADADRLERFWFDGQRGVMVFVNGVAIGNAWHDEEPVADRFSAVAPLHRGENRILVKVAARGGDMRAVFSLRHEPADPLGRIALLERLAADFPDNAEDGVAAINEASHLWEGLGLFDKAAAELNGIPDRDGVSTQQVDSSFFERARLHRLLRDLGAVANDIDGLAKRRLAANTNPAEAAIAGLKIARLWEQMGFPDKGLAATDALLKGEGVTPGVAIETGFERARLHQLLKQDDLVPGDLLDIVARLPEGHPERFEIQLEALSRQLALGHAEETTKLLASQPDDAQGVYRASRLHNLLASACESQGDQAGRLAHLLKVIAAGRGSEMIRAAQQVEYAEGVADQGGGSEASVAEAISHYREALALCTTLAHPLVQSQRSIADQAIAAHQPGPALQALRSAYVRAILVETPAGAALLESALKSTPPVAAEGTYKNLLLSPLIRDFWAIGPFPNDGWQCYDKPPVAAGKVDTHKPVQGRSWIRPGPDAYHEGVLDLKSLFVKDNSVAFVYREIDVPNATDGELSCGSDDGMVLWLNGKKLHEDREQRAAHLGDVVVQAHFNAGTNTLLAMIQQGTGDWGVVINVTNGASRGLNLAQALNMAERTGDARAAAAAVLIEQIDGLMKSGEASSAAAVARLVARAFPERPDLELASVDRLPTPELVTWIEGSCERRGFPDKQRALDSFRPRAAERLQASGDLGGAAALLRTIERTVFAADTQTRTLVQLADLYRMAGYPRIAAEYYRRAAERPIADEALRAKVHEGLFRVRGDKSDNAAFATSLDAATMVQTADRAIAASDIERGLRAYQRAIDTHGGELIKLGDGKLVGISEYVADRLSALTDAALASYRKLFDARAAERFAAAEAASDATVFAQIARDYPASSVAEQALERAAGLYLSAGAPRQAGDLLTRIIAGVAAGTPPATRALLVAKLAYAEIAAGDLASARLAVAKLKAPPCAGTSLTVRGHAVTAEAYAGELAASIDAAAKAGQVRWPTTGGDSLRQGASQASPLPVACRFETILPMHPAELMAAERFAPAPWQQVMMQVASDGNAAYLHTLDECFAIDLGTGALRWRSSEGFGALRHPTRPDGFAGLPETMTTVVDGRVFARALHHGSTGAVYAIEARDAAQGTLLWSSEAGEATSDASAVSSPACAEGVVVAVFQDVQERSRSFAAGFAAADGHLLWHTPLAFGLANLTLSSQQEIYLGDHLAAPSIAGDDVYISTDMGSIVDLELSSGTMRWASTYQRALLDPINGAEIVRQLADRAASRIVVGQELLYVAPRDTIAVLAIARANGSVAWRQELSDARALVGLSGAGAEIALITQGHGLTALSGASGEMRWHWLPNGDEQLWGEAAIGRTSIYVPTSLALTRLEPANGRSQARQVWSELGVDQPIGNLVLLNDLLLGVGRERLVALTTAASSAATLRVEVPRRASDAHIALTGLGIGPFAPPLAFRWRLATSGTVSFIRPTGADPAELYLGFEDRLLRLDGDGTHIIWDAPMPPGMTRCEVAGGQLVATFPRSIIALDQGTGRLLWTRALSYDDAGFFLDTDNRERRFAEVVVSPSVLASWRPGTRHVEIIDAHSGALTARVGFPGELHWVGLSGDQVLGLQSKGERTWIEGRLLTTGQVGWTQDLALREKNFRRFAGALSADRTTAYLCFENNVIALALGERKLLYNEPMPLGENASLNVVDGRLVTTSRRNDGWWTTAVDAATGKTVLDAEYQHGWGSSPLTPYRLTADRAISITDQRVNGHQVVICRGLAEGKEVWTTDLGDGWRHRCVGAEISGRQLVLIERSEEDLRLHYRCLSMEDGRPTGGGILAGLDVRHREVAMPTAMVGGQLVFNATDGVCAVAGLPASTAGHGPLEAAITSLAALNGPDREGASEFLAIHRPDLRPALYTRQPLRIDGHLEDWAGIDAIELNDAFCLRREPGGSWNGPQELSARVRVAWDRRFIYLAADTTDDHYDAPAPGGSPLDGDSLVVGIDPDGSIGGNEERRPLVFAISLSPRDGKTHITQLAGPTLLTHESADDSDAGDTPKEGEDDRASARMVRRAHGCTYEVALPWAAVRTNPAERPGWRTTMGIGVALLDWQGGHPRAALEWGNGLVRGISPSRFSQVAFVDLTPERIASYRKFIELMPSHEFAWRFESRIAATHVGLAGVPGRIAEMEGFIKANPGSVHATRALAELDRLYRLAGVEQASDKAGQLASAAGLAPRAIGDAVGPSSVSKDQGRALRQWVYLDPARPAQEIMLQVHSPTEGWNHRVYWGSDLIGFGEPNSTQRWPLGALPQPGQWAQLVIPISCLGIDNQLIDALSFVVHDGTAYWGRSEFVSDGKVQVLIDGALPAKASFDRGVEWSDKVQQDGKKSHTIGFQAGDGSATLRDGSLSVDLRSAQPPAAPDIKQQKTYEQAAKLIADSDEALPLLADAEGQFRDLQGDARVAAILAMDRDFLKVDSSNPQAVHVLTRIRLMLEDWSTEKPPPKRAAAVARCEALMDEAKLGREIRRQFYGQFSPGIADWKVVGWFDSQKGARALLEVLAPERGDIDLDAHYANQRGDDLRWQDQRTSFTNDTNVLKVVGNRHQREHLHRPIAYACTRVEAPANAEAILLIGIRGDCLVWVNGKRVGGQLSGERNFQRDAFAVPCKLVKGINEILVKTIADEGGALLSVRIADLNGKPIEGLLARLPPGLLGATALSATRLEVAFSGPVERESAEAIANYAIDHDVAISAATLSKDHRVVTLTTSAIDLSNDYVLTLGGVKSPTGTPLRDGVRLHYHLQPGDVGTGLKAEFYEGREFKDLLATRLDETIDFDWAEGEPPDPAVHAYNFCVRWSGQLLPRYSDSYTITTVSDDGIRLSIDGKKVIDNWTDHGPTEDSGTVTLESGKRYDILIEYFQGGSTACAKLLWSSSKQAQEIIPASQLFPPAGAAAPPASPAGKKK